MLSDVQKQNHKKYYDKQASDEKTGCSKARDKETHMIEQGIFSISVLLKYNWITSGSTRGCFMLTAPRQ